MDKEELAAEVTRVLRSDHCVECAIGRIEPQHYVAYQGAIH